MIGSFHLIQNLVHRTVDPCPKSMHKKKVNVIFSHCTSKTYLAKNRSVQRTSLFLVSNLFQVPTKADWARIAGDFTRLPKLFGGCWREARRHHLPAEIWKCLLQLQGKSLWPFMHLFTFLYPQDRPYTETGSSNAGGVVCPCLLEENVWWQHRQPMCTTHL